MAEVDVLIVPSLRASALKASNILVSSHYDVVFLNFPHNLQTVVSSCVLGITTFRELVDKINCGRLVPEPVSSWLFLNEPLLEALQNLGRNVKVYCYRDVDHNHILADAASKIANLTFRVNVTGKVDVAEWIKILKETFRPELTELEAEFIGLKAENRSACISSLSGWKLAQRIRMFGHTVKTRCVEKLYCFRPIETFEVLLEKGKLTQEDGEKLIREHAKFIRDYVLNAKNIDEAYRLWVGRHKIISLGAKF